MSQNKILSINPIGHDTSVSLMINGEIVAACEQERYTKDKHSRLFPIDAMNDCLSIGGITIDSVDLIVVPWDKDLMIREFYLRNALNNDKRLEFLRNDLKRVEELFEIEALIRDRTKYKGRIEFVNHHLAHLASSYYSSGFKDSLVVSYDGSGETDTMAIAVADLNHIEVKEHSNQYPNSIGLLYAAVTYFLGWKYACDEGIVMGLASMGNPNAEIPGKDGVTYLDVFEKTLKTLDDYSFQLNMPDYMNFYEARDVWVGDKFIEYFGKKREYEDEITEHHKNIAAALQKRIEDVVVSQLKLARKKFKKNKLCISGGVGLNCSMNGVIAKEKIFDEIFVVPAAGDAGTTIGACYIGETILGQKIEIKKRHNFYLGSSFNEAQIIDSLNNANVKYYKSDSVCKETAKRIASGEIIAWCQGAAEFGPRALGNRSILTKPFPAEMKDYVNEKVKFREGFRPFAPAVMHEYVQEYFQVDQECPHMLMAVQAREDNKDSISATVHTDNSCRVQTVKKENNKKFWSLLNAFNEITGIPVLLNTSFNVKGQPIVNTPKEAVETLLSTNIDCLVIGDYIVDKKNV